MKAKAGLLSLLLFLSFNFCNDSDLSSAGSFKDQVLLFVEVKDAEGLDYTSGVVEVTIENLNNRKMSDYIGPNAHATFEFWRRELSNPDEGIIISQICIRDDEYNVCEIINERIQVHLGNPQRKTINLDNVENFGLFWETFDFSREYDLSGKRVLGVVGEDFDCQEYGIITNYLRSCGAEVTTASYVLQLTGHKYSGSIGSLERVNKDITADLLLQNVNLNNYDMIFIPGGNGPASLLENYPESRDFVRNAYEAELLIGAICHGPLLVAESGIITGRNITGHTDVEAAVEENGGIYTHMNDERVIIDGTIITGNWPSFGTVAQTLAEELERR